MHLSIRKACIETLNWQTFTLKMQFWDNKNTEHYFFPCGGSSAVQLWILDWGRKAAVQNLRWIFCGVSSGEELNRRLFSQSNETVCPELQCFAFNQCHSN